MPIRVTKTPVQILPIRVTKTPVIEASETFIEAAKSPKY